MKSLILDEIWKEEYFLPMTNIPMHRPDAEVLYKRKLRRSIPDGDNNVNTADEQWTAENIKSSFLSAR